MFFKSETLTECFTVRRVPKVIACIRCPFLWRQSTFKTLNPTIYIFSKKSRSKNCNAPPPDLNVSLVPVFMKDCDFPNTYGPYRLKNKSALK